MIGFANPSVNQMSGDARSYPAEEQEETARLTRSQDPRWQLVLPVTRGTREYIIEQMPALIATYGVAITLILAVVMIEGAHPPSVVAVWLLESAASIAVRILVFRRMVRASPVEIASNPRLRLLPVLAITLAALHWGWTATLFFGPHLNLTSLVMLLTYVMLSIACLGIAPASPVICAAYLVPMWSTMTWMLVRSDWVTGSTLLALCAALAGIFCASFYIIVSGVRRNLVRSDEVDLLMRELQERNREVERMRAAVAADLETRATVFASASHDLRQRIHALKLLAHTNAVGAAARSPWRRVASTIEDLEGFVTDVLQSVRFDSNGGADRMSVVALQEILQGIELHFETLALERGARLRTRATALCVQTDVVMLGRVLENLVSNALKFTRKDVLLVARRRNDDVSLEVWDQGQGLDPRRLDSSAVFSSGMAAQATSPGFGLGLMIVRRLVDVLGYTIEVQSTAARGTLVRVVIPARHICSGGLQ